MSDIRNLYQEIVLDHYRKPRNFRPLDYANRKADGVNPFCGDKLTVFLLIEEKTVHDIGFTGSGCAISIASASLMTESLKGKTEAEARLLLNCFHRLTDATAETNTDLSALGDLAVFGSLREYPVRIKCATLAWEALRVALEERQETATTE